MTKQIEEKEFHQMYLIHGAEDLLILEAQDEIRSNAYSLGFTERSRFYFDARSNWDGIFGVATVAGLDARITFIGKHTVFKIRFRIFSKIYGRNTSR